MRKALKYTAGGLIGAAATTLLLGGQAFAAEDDPVAVLGQQTNLLWVVLGGVLVVFMQAGFALVETGFTQKKNANHVMSTNFAIFGLGFIGFLFIGFPLAFSGFSYSAFGLSTPMNGDGLPAIGGASTGILYWVVQPPRRRGRTGTARLLLLHGRLHGHGRHDPNRGNGRALEVEGLRSVGPVLRSDLLPAVRRLDVGWRLARQELGHDEPRCRLRRLRRLRRRTRCRRSRSARGSNHPRATYRQVRAGWQAKCDTRTQHPDGSARLLHPVCSAGSDSTPHRPSP